MQDWKAKQAAKAAAASALQAANPHLVPVSEKNNSLIAAAKNARIELARAFPDVKFSVKTKRFSGGTSMDVSWTDGPTSGQVEAIVDKYAAGSFYGMTDSYDYAQSAWTDAFGDAKYVFAHRDDSIRAIESAIRSVFLRYELPGIEKPTAEQFMKGECWNTQTTHNDNLQQLIRSMAYKRTWAIDKTPKAAAMVEAEEVAA